MKILLLSKKFPYPLKDGESIAVHTLSKSLANLGCEVSLLAMNTSKHFFDKQDFPADLNHFKRIEMVEIDNRVKPVEAFANLFSSESYHISRFVSNEYAKKLQEFLRKEEYDVVQMETLYLAPYIDVVRKNSNAIVAMRAHNVEHEIWERIVKHAPQGPKKWYLKHLTDKLYRFELEALQQYDLLVPITQRDLKIFQKMGFRKKAIVTPIGLSVDTYEADYTSYRGKPTVSFIGSLDWMPNIEGLQWFIQKVWPAIRKKHPELEFHIAGRNTPNSLLNLRSKNITVHGEVPDAAKFINQHSLMVVPLLSGSGMRAKILEAMTLGKVVVTTSLGLEGIHATQNEEVLIADTKEDFLKAFDQIFQQVHKLEVIGRNAQAFAGEQYDSYNIAKSLLKVYNQQVAPVEV